MHSQFVDRRETLRAVLTLVLPLAMMRPDVFANNRILNERSLAVRTTEYTILVSVRLNVILQHRTLTKHLPTYRALEDLFIFCKSLFVIAHSDLALFKLVIAYSIGAYH